ITDKAQELFAATPADVVLHTTGSYLAQVRPQLEEIVDAGLNVVSTCEELAYPRAQHPDIAEELDRRCRQRGVTVLGTGVNPGFVMDTLALVLSGVCQDVTAVRCQRVVDASSRRQPLQKKIGSGLTREEFQRLVDARQVRHVGLYESVAMIADALGWRLDRVEGTPNVDLVLRGGTHGDRATTALVVNAARRVVEAPPGIITMKDLPPATWFK